MYCNKNFDFSFRCRYFASDMNKKNSHLVKITKRLLEDCDKPDYVIAVDLGVSPNSIRNVRKGDHNPNIVFIENLYEYLSGRKISDLDL